jgi:hypothetical protein
MTFHNKLFFGISDSHRWGALVKFACFAPLIAGKQPTTGIVFALFFRHRLSANLRRRRSKGEKFSRCWNASYIRLWLGNRMDGRCPIRFG